MSPTPGTHSGQIDALRPTTQPGTGIHTALESIVLVCGSWEACQRLWNILIPGLYSFIACLHQPVAFLSPGEITSLAWWHSLLSSGAPVALGTGQHMGLILPCSFLGTNFSSPLRQVLKGINQPKAPLCLQDKENQAFPKERTKVEIWLQLVKILNYKT